MTTTLQDTIEREVTVRASQERVFQAITDPAQLVAWFPDKIEGAIAVGERPIFEFTGEARAALYVVAVEPNDYFAYRWIPSCADFPDGFEGDVLSQPNTLVEFRVTAVAGGTRVTVKESGLASLPPRMYTKAFEDNSGGWEYMMARLEKLMVAG